MTDPARVRTAASSTLSDEVDVPGRSDPGRCRSFGPRQCHPSSDDEPLPIIRTQASGPGHRDRGIGTGARIAHGRSDARPLMACLGLDTRRLVASAASGTLPCPPTNPSGRVNPRVARALPVWVCPSRSSWRGAPGRRRWSRWSARSEARTYDLDQPEGRCRLGMGRLTAAWGRPALPGCSTKVMSSATTIVIWVSPVAWEARSRRCYKAVQPEGWRARAWQELTAVETRDVGVGSPGPRRRR
jgi:hypothetical protein